MRILRGLTSRLLPCGCVAGVYETYDGDVVTLLDEPQTGCPDSKHTEGNQIPDLAEFARSKHAAANHEPSRHS